MTPDPIEQALQALNEAVAEYERLAADYKKVGGLLRKVRADVMLEKVERLTASYNSTVQHYTVAKEGV